MTKKTLPPPRTEAALWIDPARRSGRACITGTRIDCRTIAHVVAHGGMHELQDGWGPLDRRDVLVACAWFTLFDPVCDKSDEVLQKRWRRWALKAWRQMWHSDDEATAAVKDPPREIVR